MVSDFDWEQLVAIWADEEKWAAVPVDNLRMAAGTHPQLPELRVQHALEELLLIELVHATQPGWCNVICRARDDLADCLVLVSSPLGEQAVVFMFGMQNPLASGFLIVSCKRSFASRWSEG